MKFRKGLTAFAIKNWRSSGRFDDMTITEFEDIVKSAEYPFRIDVHQGIHPPLYLGPEEAAAHYRAQRRVARSVRVNITNEGVVLTGRGRRRWLKDAGLSGDWRRDSDSGKWRLVGVLVAPWGAVPL